MTVPEETRTDVDPACSNCGGVGWYLDEAQVRVCCPLCNAHGNKRVDLADRTPQELAGIVRWALGAAPKGDALAALALLVEAAEQAQRGEAEWRAKALEMAAILKPADGSSFGCGDDYSEKERALGYGTIDDPRFMSQAHILAESRLRTAETALRDMIDLATRGLDLTPHDPIGWHGGMEGNIAACPVCRINKASEAVSS